MVLLDPTYEDPEVRAAAFARIPMERLAKAVATVGDLAHPPDDNYYDELVGRYSTIRRFLPLLLQTISFDAIEVGQPVLEAWEFLKGIEGQGKPTMSQAPHAVVSKPWRRFVFRTRRQVDRRYYTFCTLERLQDGLRRRDIFVADSERWGDPRARLLQAGDMGVVAVAGMSWHGPLTYSRC